MACVKKGCAKNNELTDERLRILTVLASSVEPKAGKEIAVDSGIDGKSISCKMRSLKTNGYVDSPIRCKYTITDAGRAVL